MRFKGAVFNYLHSRQFNSLSRSSQVNYEYNLNSTCRMTVMGKTVGDIRLDRINVPLCVEIYDTWEAQSSTAYANHKARVFSVVMNHMCMLEYITHNPMARVKKRKATPRSVVWTHEQVMTFLESAFTKYEWRSIGLIVLMCYEWGQRPVDIRNLLWDNVDLDQGKVTITQTKRGSVVELPIPDNLMEMLSEQKKDLDFQPYVVPHHRPQDRAYRPLMIGQMTSLLKEVKAHAGLPDELQVGDLRKTAIVQMIESGIDHLAIQSVSGHKSVASLNPYNKFSFKTAKNALDRRQKE